MILQEKIEIKNHPHYHKLLVELFGENLSKLSYTIDVSNLSINSHKKILVKCDICGKQKYLSYSKYNKNTKNQTKKYTCSEKCSTIKKKETNEKKYGDKNYNNIKKTKNTKLIKYGDENYNNRDKFIKTNDNRYGGHFNKLEDFKQKIKSTKNKKYGDENYNNIEKMLNTIFNKYNTNCTLLLPEIHKKTITTNILKLEEKYNVKILNYDDSELLCECDKGHDYKISTHLLYDRCRYNVEKCTICNPIGVQNSHKEIELLNFIKSNYNGKIITNDRTQLNGKELDIYLPELNLAFEFNGDYWHSLKQKPNNYHLSKTEMCESLGIDLIHVYEFLWQSKKDNIKKIILSKINNTPYQDDCFLFEKDNLIWEDKCFNLQKNKTTYMFSSGPLIIKVGVHEIELPGYNIYKKLIN